MMPFHRTQLRTLTLLGFIGLLILSPLSAQQAPPEATAEITPEATTDATPAPCVQVDGANGPCTYETLINPLTGLPVADSAILARRPIVVKISNSPALVRPQAGLNDADLVFEHYTEVGITRFSGVFYGNSPSRVGSMRSARLIDYELVPMYDGLLAFAGASIGVDKRIYGSEAVIESLCATREDYEQCRLEADIIGPPGFAAPSDFVDQAYKAVLFGAPSFYRDETIPVPHNLFVDLEALWQRAERDGVATRERDLHGMGFHPEVQNTPDGSGVYAQVRYMTTLVEWHYDVNSNRYYRSTDGQLHYDANIDEQVSAANVIIVYAGHYLTDIIESQYADTIHWSAQITVWPQGDAIILRDGLRFEGRWLRPTRTDQLTFVTDDGETIYLQPGNTWVQLMPLPEQLNPDNEWVIVE
ncbi:MAG: DUF3048 domain-containing protein [Anaerolineae bacterium]